MIRNLRCTVTIDTVLANSKTQNAFLFTLNAIFRHDYPLAVEPGSTPRPLVQKKKLGEVLYLLICSFLPCLSWLLRSRVRKSRRDLWITLYMPDFGRKGEGERPLGKPRHTREENIKITFKSNSSSVLGFG